MWRIVCSCDEWVWCLCVSDRLSSSSSTAAALTGRAVTSGRGLGAGERRLPQLDRLPPRTRTAAGCRPAHTDTHTHTPSAPSVWASPPAMRDYSATPSNGGACMPCCQVCVFAFTAFLIVAERTARESYLGHTHTHTHTLTHKHTPSTFINEVCVLCDWQCHFYVVVLVCVIWLYWCARAYARPRYVCVRVCVCVCGLEETLGETECFRW